MNRRTYRTAIPKDAVEVIEEYHPEGAKKAASYFVNGEKVGHREWYEDGQLDWEQGMRGGRTTREAILLLPQWAVVGDGVLP